MARTISFLATIICYLIGVAGLFYFIFWIGDLLPVNSINAQPKHGLGGALLINSSLITLFGLQHTIMARKDFKRAWTKIIPAQLERSMYIFISGILCIVIPYFWSPIEGSLWNFEMNTFGFYFTYALFFLGIVVLLFSTFLINHFELFGLQQGYLHMMQRTANKPQFTTFALYRIVRHPIYLGFMMILWCTPTMTFTHLCLSTFFTIYIFVGIYFEERDLVREYGNTYKKYRKNVPSVIPFTKKGNRNYIPDENVVAG